jgi:hypothetical protein
MQKHGPYSRGVTTAIRIGFFLVILADGVDRSKASTFLDAWQEIMPRGGELSGITYGDGHFVAVGPRGELLTSTNAVNWERGTIPSAGLITDVRYGNGLFLAVGSVSNQLGVAMVSTNPIDWRTNIVSGNRVESCAFGNGLFVVSCYDSLLSSSDGVHWTPRNPGPLYSWGVDFAGNQFVVVGPGGQRTASADGITWSTPIPGDGRDLWASVYGNGTTVMVGSNQRIRTISPTNTTESPEWSEVDLRDIAYGNGRFVAVGLLYGLGVIWTSADGFAWEHPCLGEFAMLERVTFSYGLFVAVGIGGTVVTSPDGLNWTLRRGGVPAQSFSAAAANGIVVTVGGGYNAVGTALALCPDWSWRCPAWDYGIMPQSVLYAKDQFLVVGTGGSVSTSPDGTVWTHRNSATTECLKSVTCGQGQYVAVGYGGQVERSGDGITWTNQSVAAGKYGSVMFVMGNSM